MEGLEHDADVVAAQIGQFVVVELAERPAVQPHRTRGRLLQSGEQYQQRGLAGAERTDDRHRLAGGDLEIDSTEHVQAAIVEFVGHAEVVELDHCFAPFRPVP